MAKRRSFGSVFLDFIRGLVSFILFLVLVASVGANVVFRNKDSAPRIDFLNYHITFFINRSGDLKNIPENSLCFIDHTATPKENTYVLCTVGNEAKRVYCLESITENGNGSRSYNLRADLMSSLDTIYSVPASKIFGLVYNKDDLAGEIIVFSTQTMGVVSLMIIPALLLIILSIAAIRSKRARYDDDLLEAEMFIEEKRKQKRNEEKRADEHRKQLAEKAAAEAESALAARARVEAAVREAEATAAQNAAKLAEPVSDPDPAPFAFEEYKRKADEVASEQVSAPAPVPEASPVAAASPVKEEAPAPAPVQTAPAPEKHEAPLTETVNKYEFAEFSSEPENKAEEKKEEPEEKPVFTEVPLSVRPSYRYEQMIQNLSASSSEVKKEEPVSEPEPAPAPAPVHAQTPAPQPAKKPSHPAVKKKAKQPVKKLNADSIDDLIRILEEEKKKLD